MHSLALLMYSLAASHSFADDATIGTARLNLIIHPTSGQRGWQWRGLMRVDHLILAVGEQLRAEGT